MSPSAEYCALSGGSACDACAVCGVPSHVVCWCDGIRSTPHCTHVSHTPLYCICLSTPLNQHAWNDWFIPIAARACTGVMAWRRWLQKQGAQQTLLGRQQARSHMPLLLPQLAMMQRVRSQVVQQPAALVAAAHLQPPGAGGTCWTSWWGGEWVCSEAGGGVLHCSGRLFVCLQPQQHLQFCTCTS